MVLGIITNKLILLLQICVWTTNYIGIEALSLNSDLSLLANTKWKCRLDVGVQPGTWMPKRFPSWGESGARLVVDTPELEFTNIPSSESERLVGPKDETRILKVCNGGNSTFISEKGEQQVTFVGGGWCVQRPTADLKNADGAFVKPEGLLRFWLDCPSGAKKRDTEIFLNTRIFFTTGVWDDPSGLSTLENEYSRVTDELQSTVESIRSADSSKKNYGINIFEQARDFRQMVTYTENFQKLKDRKSTLERMSPPSKSSRSKNGVLIAPTGSLVIKGNDTPDWLPGSEYLILGTFSSKALDVE